MLTSLQPIINLGDIKSGNPIHHIFNVRNDYPFAVDIVSAGASCGCTTPTLSKKGILQPHELLQVTINANTSGRSGLFSKSVYIDYIENKTAKKFVQSFTANIIK